MMRVAVAVALAAGLGVLAGCGKSKPTDSAPPGDPNPADTGSVQGARPGFIPSIVGGSATKGIGNPAPPKKAAPPEPEPPAKADWTGTAADFVAAGWNFRKGFVGKWVEVQSTVSAVGPAATESTHRYLNLDAGKGPLNFTCRVTIKQAPAGRFSNGQTVRLIGMVELDGEYRVKLVPAVVKDVGPSTAISVKPGELVQSTTNYNQKTVIVTGKVAEIKNTPQGRTIVFDGGPGGRVECTLCDGTVVVPVKAGEECRLTGTFGGYAGSEKRALVRDCEFLPVRSDRP